MICQGQITAGGQPAQVVCATILATRLQKQRNDSVVLVPTSLEITDSSFADRAILMQQDGLT